MEIRIIDIWLEKIRRGWKIEDAPNEEIRKELRKRLGVAEEEIMKPYDYSDIKLTCPFCKSEMDFDTILVDHEFNIPYYIDYCCSNGGCQFELRLDFVEFDDRLPDNDLRKDDHIVTDSK